MASIAPLSVQLTDRISLPDRKRVASRSKEVTDAQKIITKLAEAAALQQSLGLGNPRAAVETRKGDLAKMNLLAQAEKLAEKFRAVQEPSEKFFPRFAYETGGRRVGNMASGSTRGRLPELIMVKLEAGMEKVYCRVENPSAGMKSNYEANIPCMPLTALELAGRAKKLAPDAQFHLLFLPSWEPAPQRDPVLVAHLPGTDEYFEIASWDGDVALIQEFLEYAD